jgi:ABC-type transport system involved in multi-copper enzyme maturation permease subunit
MLKAMIRLQWKGCWHLVVALAVAALALPLVSVRTGWRSAGEQLPRFLIELQLWGLFYPALAALTAVILAAAIWASDRRGHHIYALLLPIPRWRYVLLRYLAGLVLLLPVVLALWLGAGIATASLDLPPGLREFPHALAAKFGLALLLLFGLAFAIAAASRRALGIGMKLIGLFLAVHIAVILLSPKTNLIWTVVTALSTWPGPFAPLGGRWMLIDV